MTSKLFLATLTLIIILTSSVYADPRDDKAAPGRVLKAALNLSEEQLAALRELVESRATEVREIKGEINELQSQLEELLKSDAPEQAEIGGLVLDTRILKQEIRQGREAYQGSFHALLTEAQIERLRRINKVALANRASDVLHELKLR